MNEKEFIYQRLNYLHEQLNSLAEIVEKQSNLIGNISDLLEHMQSPEYASKQANLAEMKDVTDKINLMRNIHKFTKK
ncbi:hypothetical protein ACU3L3_07290 [Priestia endophytica]